MNSRQQREFYQKYSGRLYNAAFRILSDSFEAEDVMQDTIIRYLDSHLRLNSPEQESAWLTRTCIRMSIDVLRKRRRRDAFFGDLALSQDTETEIEENEDYEGITVTDIVNQIQLLPDLYRVVLDLVLIEGMEYHEISEMTGEKEVTIRTKFSRGRKMLSDNLRTLIAQRNG